MADEILSYLDVCLREGVNLQKGMYFGVGQGHSLLLMSLRSNAPYRDGFEDGGSTLIYEGHDVKRSVIGPDPKLTDQPEFTKGGALTENGKFHKAAQDYRQGLRPPEKVRIYEKIRMGIWAYSGLYALVDSWRESAGKRTVFKFKLIAVEDDTPAITGTSIPIDRRRVIPTAVKLTVWKRDGGKCVVCGATDELHFDHIIPYAKGGTSVKAENVQLLCARHNLAKSDKIE